MARVSGSNTKPEIIVRRILYGLGFRYRINVRKLPGTPDIVLSKHNKVVFVHGCFWHRHKGCKDATMPKSNREFWGNKFAANVKRFEDVSKQLKDIGWRIEVVWECETRNTEALESRFSNRFVNCAV